MKTTINNLLRTFVIQSVVLTSIHAAMAQGIDTWNGGGADGKWTTPANWGGTPPSAGDALIFTGTVRLVNTNTFAAGTPFDGITFGSPAGGFVLRGAGIVLTNDIVDNQVVVNESVNLPVSLDATHNLNVIGNGSLTISNVISGAAGAGLTLPGAGQVTLTATNTFTGPVTINGGTLTVSSDANLGAVPASVTPGAIVINGGTLQTTNTFLLNANRGIAVGPTSGSGSGTVDVENGGGTTPQILTYGGVVANNGSGTGGLTKIGFGSLTLSGTNTYTGPTAVKNGTLTLDLTQTTSPVNNAIRTNSSLILGGSTSGKGTTNFSALVMIPKGSTVTNSQTFNGTFVDIGAAYIQAKSNNLGTANINLGLLSHTNGGVVNIILPTLQGGNGNITTTLTNDNGILGGWATVSGGLVPSGNLLPPIPTNFASVDINGNIVNYTNYTIYNSSAVYPSGNLFLTNIIKATNNIMIDGTSSGDVTLDADNAGSTNDVNTISMNRVTSWSFQIGISNVLRLGQHGAIFVQQQTASPQWEIGSSVGGANTTLDQDIGTITAGGPNYNTPGELIIYRDEPSTGSTAQMAIDCQIADNGPNGPVTLIKAGPGYMKLRGHNTYSGGTYFLQGRIQFSGTEAGGATATGINPDACGTGPCYVFPGSYIYFNPAVAGTHFTNDLYLAGNGTQQEPLGALRPQNVGWIIDSKITLIGDTTIGGNNGLINGPISGPFNLTIGSGATVAGSDQFGNQGDSWTGNTTMQNRSSASSSFINGTNDVIPNGFGFGNVIMSGYSGGTYTWNLNGFNETVNGLSTIGTAASCTIVNNGATPSTLAIGDNDQSGTFGGNIEDGTSTMAVTKIGAGIETLNGATLSYSGNTTISNGTLAVSGIGGALTGSAIQVNSGGVLDASAVSGGNIGNGNGIGINGGRLIANISGSSSVSNLGLTNSDVQVVLNPATVNVQNGGALAIDGATNLLDIAAIQNVASYPVQFTVIKYGSLGGGSFNFGLGTLPTDTTVGYVSNNTANGSVDIVLANGPKLLTWTGASSTNWDFTTPNWKFGSSPVVYNDQDSPVFDDTAASGLVNLTATVTPGSITVSNNTLPYVFTGPGNITGFSSLTKSGAGSLTVTNSGVDNYSGGVVVNGGTLTFAVTNNITGGMSVNNSTVQLIAGNLPSGNIVCSAATLLFNGSGDLAVNNSISDGGSSLVIKTNTDTVTMGGASTYSGNTYVNQGTLKAGGGGAFGFNGTVYVTNNATLDVGGQTIQSTTTGPATVVVSGAGAGGNGVIVNSGPDNINAFLNVTLAGDTTFGGGTGRWDIRTATTTASLNTGGQPYNLTKVGTNIVALVAVNVDGALSNIYVMQGELGIETSTSPNMGDTTTSAIYVSPGAWIELYANTSSLYKPLVLNGDGVDNTVLNDSGATSISSQTIALNSGNCVFNVGGTSLSLNDSGSGNTLSGNGGLTKVGGAPLYINIPLAYAGTTVVSNGFLVVDAPETNSSSITVAGGTLAVGVDPNTGVNAWLASPVTVLAGGTLSPGDTNSTGGATSLFTLAISNSLTLAGTCAMDVTKNGDGSFTSDLITNVTTLTYGGALSLNLDTNDSATVMQAGDIIPLFAFNHASGVFAAITPSNPGTGLYWDQTHLAVDGTLRVTATPPVSTTPPVIGGVRLSAGSIVISGTSADSGNYVVLTSTNVALPLLQWTPLVTNAFDGGGNFSFTNTVAPGTPQLFYLLKLQ